MAANDAAGARENRFPDLGRLLRDAGAAVPTQGAAVLLVDRSGRGLAFSASRRLAPA